ncbi:MAG: AgmX/PglI C-terminal domain-containing protein [Myxococcota bacterium]|nr:AgmX/PglI C-terminal domain-containing protein [Myxococcota bacterium]
MAIEITTRWGDTLIDITQIDAGDFTLVDRQLVYEGQLVAAPEGRLGQISYTAVEITRPARSVPFARHGDRHWLPYVGLALLAHVGLWVVATIGHPPLERRAPVVAAQRPIKIARVAAEPARSYVPPDDRARDRVDDTKSQGQAKAMEGPSGAAGAISPVKRGHVAVKNTGEEAQLTKAEAVERARRAGVLGSSQVLLESYATLGGADRITSAFDAIDVAAPLAGGAGTAGGSFGLGHTGGGAGGGGHYGTIGVGHIGTFSSGTTHGHGWGGSRAPSTPWRTWDGGDGGDYRYTVYPRRHLSRRFSTVQICPQDAPPCTVDGALDKAIVRRYVKRNVQKLSYCYEKELLARPAIRGLVTITFAVGDEGHVELARASGFDETVATCVRGVFESIELPRGATVVAYVLRFELPA